MTEFVQRSWSCFEDKNSLAACNSIQRVSRNWWDPFRFQITGEFPWHLLFPRFWKESCSTKFLCFLSNRKLLSKFSIRISELRSLVQISLLANSRWLAPSSGQETVHNRRLHWPVQRHLTMFCMSTCSWLCRPVGISGTALRWFRNFSFRSATKRVVVNNKSCSFFTCKQGGSPQGSVLAHGRTQRGFEGGSPNPAGDLGGRCEPPSGVRGRAPEDFWN